MVQEYKKVIACLLLQCVGTTRCCPGKVLQSYTLELGGAPQQMGQAPTPTVDTSTPYRSDYLAFSHLIRGQFRVIKHLYKLRENTVMPY
jgi:hypothetical protein